MARKQANKPAATPKGPIAKADKVIVTNLSALKAKYAANLPAIQAAIKGLIAADRGRGLTTVLVALDDAAAMQKLGAKPVKTAGDPKQNKVAIDGVYNAYVPDYLMILGAIDIVPHQDMLNPAYLPGGADPDQYAYGDLPYACGAAYGQDPANFTAPTRVVGRLPDINGNRDHEYLVGVLQTAASYAPGPFAAYANHLGISAAVWQNSTSLSLQKTFGSASALQLSPPSGPHWTAAQLQALSHFINCHGADTDPHFYGQQGANYPIAHDAAYLAGKVQRGTVVSAECCYGAQLYAPSPLTTTQPGICNAYLGSGAYGFFGSSTIAYGPAAGNGSADLICQFFLQQVLSGASLGRAALQARQNFVLASPVLGPIDLKTLAQFSLLADPSVQAVQAARAAHLLPKSAKGLSLAAAEAAAPGVGRTLRREQLARVGLALGAAAKTILSEDRSDPPSRIKSILRQEAKLAGLIDVGFATFPVAAAGLAGVRFALAAMAKLAPALARPSAPEEVHLAIGRIPAPEAPAPQLHAIVVHEEDRQMIVRHLFSR